MSTEESLVKWLMESGYPLEMEVASAFEGLPDANVYQADYYVDPDTKDPREIDVVCWTWNEITEESMTWLDIVLHIECKRSPGKPWVLFLGRPRKTSSTYDQLLRNRIAKGVLREATKDLGPKELPLFHAPHPAYGMAQAHRSKDAVDDCYRALMQSVKAARQRIVESEQRPFFPLAPDIDISIPVIVVDGDLYTASLDKQTKKIDLRRCLNQVVMWRNPAGGGSGSTPVHVVSRDHLPAFVKAVQLSRTALVDWLKTQGDRIAEVVKEERERESSRKVAL